jgi:RNA-binding protein PNO1
LKKEWEKIYTPIVEKMDLQIRMNPKKRVVELRTSEHTKEENAVQKSADFINAFLYGFDISDAVALLRLDDIFVESFEIKDVKTLEGDHLGRAIGRIAGKNGSTKFTIENATKTRIVLADTRVYILGSYENIQNAKNAISDLILGSPPGQVYNKLRILSARMKESF